MPEESAQHPSRVSGALGRPFTEQVAFFRNKMGNRVPTQAWDDLDREEHDRAFMVAGAVKADLLTDLAAAVDKAISEGRGIEDFRRDFRAIVKRHGWTGWAGEGSTGGEAWRVGVIYRTNSYTSYAAGRYAQLKAGNFPWWVYRHGGALEPREAHLSWDGTPLPPDHPFWRTHYPPSDWGCSCYVVGARSQRGIRRVGGTPGKALPKGWDARDPKTGAPVGIGKGWDYAPGASVSETVRAMAAKIRSWEQRVAKAFMESLPDAQADELAQAFRRLESTSRDARSMARAVWDGGPDRPPRTLGLLTTNQSGAIEHGDAKRFDFSISADLIRHIREEHGNEARELRRGQRAVTPDDFARLPILLDGQPSYIGRSDRGDLPVYELRSTIDGETYVTRWVMRKRRRTFALLSFFVKVAGKD